MFVNGTEKSLMNNSIHSILSDRRFKDLENCGFILSFLPHGHHEKGVYYKGQAPMARSFKKANLSPFVLNFKRRKILP